MNTKATITKERRAARFSRTTTVAVIAIVLFVSLVIIKPSAPESIVLLTGPEGSSYYEMGMRLAASIEEMGLETEVRTTTGGIDNARQLAAGAANTVALAPSTVEDTLGPKVDAGGLVSLGSIAFEPFWLFSRSEHGANSIADLVGLRVATGAPGTVVDIFARTILRTSGVLDGVEIVSLNDPTVEGLATALKEGNVDAVFLTGTPASPIIRELLGHPDFTTVPFGRTAAYEAWYPGVSGIVVPEGIADLAKNIPSEDLQLLAGTTNLLTLDGIYPGVVPLVLEAVIQSGDRQRFTTSTTTFPGRESISLPLDRAAARYYDHGKTGIAKFLPYKITRWLNHLGFVVLPLLTGVFVLLKIVPLGLKIWSTIQLMGMLKELESIEKAHATGADPTNLLTRLDALDQKTAGLFIPRSMVHDYIDDRQFLHDMRERVEASAAVDNGESSTG